MNTEIKRIIVAEAQVPFVRGGAEMHVDALIDQLRVRGFEVEKVAIPFRSQPGRIDRPQLSEEKT